MPNYATKYVPVNGFATYLHYMGETTLPDVIPDFSRGRKIIFIHAAGSNGHTWHYQLEGLAEKHSPIAFDLPGHGRSEGVEGLESVDDYAEFVRHLMQAGKINSAVVAGHSMGGAAAMTLALKHPEMVEGLILVATAASFNVKERLPGLKAVTQGRAPQAFTTDGYSPKTVAQNFAVVREGWMEQIKTDPRVRYTDMLVCEATDLREQIAQIGAPTLIIAGADDQITPPAESEFIKRRISNSRLEIIPDAGHRLLVEKPAATNAAIEQFLSQLR